MSAEKYGVITTSVAAAADADAICRFLIREKLAACVQTMPIQSHYMWKGEEVQDRETLLLIKTRADLFDAAIAAIAAMHPYETPEIVATPFCAGNADYFNWIDSVTKG